MDMEEGNGCCVSVGSSSSNFSINLFIITV
jgi:hypothetical protein